MKSLIQLSPQIPVLVRHNNAWRPARAFAWLDYSEDNHVLWGVFLDDTGETWWLPNNLIRARDNVSMGRKAGQFEKNNANLFEENPLKKYFEEAAARIKDQK